VVASSSDLGHDDVMRQPDVEKIGRVFDKLAGQYDRQMGFSERLLFGRSRGWAASRARGRVLEIAVGTGLNLPLYPADTSVLGIDLSERMLDHARTRAAALGLTDRVTLYRGDVQALDVADESVDSVVSTFTFCTIPDPFSAAREAFRVLRPGGQFLLAEHGPSTRRWVRVGQRAVDPLTIRFLADHLMRDPLPYLSHAGFTIREARHDGRFGLASCVHAVKSG
jgi:ubiquinone/menaquinone biosynthesis C-methylase UbiE